jgi:hypothetical protein
MEMLRYCYHLHRAEEDDGPLGHSAALYPHHLQQAEVGLSIRDLGPRSHYSNAKGPYLEALPLPPFPCAADTDCPRSDLALCDYRGHWGRRWPGRNLSNPSHALPEIAVYISISREPFMDE